MMSIITLIKSEKYYVSAALFVLLALFPLSSCQRLEVPRSNRGKVVFNVSFEADSVKTRSSLAVADDKISSINVFAYADGEYVADAYEIGRTAQLDLMPGSSYNFYVLANLPRMTAPAKESDIISKRIALESWASISTRGFPMSYCPKKAFELESGEDEISVSMERIMSRYDFKIRKSMNYSDFTVQSVSLKQAGYDFVPFGSNGQAKAIGNGDTASQSDLRSLNAGGSVSFYVTENCQGVLLPGNRDPWQKIPDKLGQKKGLCTYLQVDGIWSSPGVSAPVSYRMYLGQDNCTDFNIVRNTINDLTLELTDDGAFASSWKVEKGKVSDNRILKFAKSSLTVLPDGKNYSCGITVNPPGIRYSVEGVAAELLNGGLSTSVSNNTFFASTSKLVASDFYTTVKLKTWDGIEKGSLQLYVPKIALSVPKGFYLFPGETYKASVGTTPSKSVTGWNVSYKSLNTAVAKVSAAVTDGTSVNVTAVASGQTTLKATYGPLTESMTMIVAPKMQKFSYSGFPSSFVSGEEQTFDVSPYPKCSLNSNIQEISVSDPEVVQVRMLEYLNGYYQEYSDYAPYYGTFNAGTRFVIEAINPGSASVTFHTSNPNYTEKKTVSVILGQSDGQYVKCVSRSSGEEMEKLCANECEFFLDRQDEAALEFTPFRPGGLVTNVSVDEMVPLKVHSGWDTHDYYSIEENSSKYHNCSWTVYGTDCLVRLSVTAGYNQENLFVYLYFGDSSGIREK